MYRIALAILLSVAATTGFAQTQPQRPSPPQQYKTEADAKAGCGSDQVVWGNTRSHVLHNPGTSYYGKTKSGAYMCKSLAEKAGYHEAKR